MPELPDLTIYRDALVARIRGRRLDRVRIVNPFVLRTAVPPLAEVEGRDVVEVRRLGKRIVLALMGEYFLVLHLMIAAVCAGRIAAPGHPPGSRLPSSSS